jgi:hypothetical protein
MDDVAIMKNYLEFDSGHDILEGALVYRIQRKQHTKSDGFTQDGSKIIQILVTWRIEYTEGLHVCALLVEYDKEFNLNEDKLRGLYQKYWYVLKGRLNPIGINWLLDDETVLKTTVKVMNGGYKWDVLISEGEEDGIEIPLWIDAERWVSMMLLISLMLTYTISLTLYNTTIMTIHNQYPNIELASPIYFCNCGTYYEYPVKRMDASTIMTVGFRSNLNQGESSGILMYELRRKSSEGSDHQSDVDVISAKDIEEVLKMTRLLVTWEIKYLEEPKVDAMLVEYDNGLVLDEDRLAKLYEKVNGMPFEVYKWVCVHSVVFERTRLGRVNTVLGAIYKAISEKSFELKMTISGIENKYIMKPFWIDPER